MSAERTETSAGGVVVRRTGGALAVALGEQRDRLTGELTTRLPKGNVEAGESLEQAARREVAEETGLAARIVAPLGAVEYVYREPEAEGGTGVSVTKRVHFFLMELEPGDPRPTDGELARIFWCPLAAAAERLTYATERSVLGRAREHLGA